MPACVPPLFYEEELDEDDDFDQWDSPRAPSPNGSGQYSTPPVQAYLSPRTPSPTALLSRGLAAVALNESGPRGEPDPQDWITWASSPPKPIPALHGPLSLPYARCPSGAEGTVIESDDRVSNVIWGLNVNGSQIRSQSDKKPATERDMDSESLEADFEADTKVDVDSGNDLLVAAAARLSNRFKGLTLDGEGVAYGVSPRSHDDPQLSGLGLHLNPKPAANHSGTRGVAPYEKANQLYSAQALSAKPNGKVSSRGPASTIKQLKFHPPASSQLPTPPLSTSTNWTPHLPNSLPPGLNFSPALTLDLATSQGTSPSLGFLGQLSFPTPPLERGANAQDWRNHPNSNNSAMEYLEDYSLGSDTVTVSGPGLDCYDQQVTQELKTATGNRRGFDEPAGLPSNRRSTTFKYDQRRKISEPNSRGGVPLPPARSSLLHRRLPVLEEDVSFTYSLSPSSRPRPQDQFTASAHSSSQAETLKKVDAGKRGDRPTPGLTPICQRAMSMKVAAGQAKPTNTSFSGSQKRWKQNKEV
ncbi:hypothetical protein H1R20_g14369, partial [Candolleomyces eurysporus]